MKKAAITIMILIILSLLVGCGKPSSQSPEKRSDQVEPEETVEEPQPIERISKIPSDAVKMTPQTDKAVPKSYSDDYNDPVPVGPPVDTAGAEDSAFVLPDGNTLYFFFTPDVKVSVEKQIIDGVTGIYMTKKLGNSWSEPKRIILQDKGKLSGDGCEFIQGNKIWFCTVREGYTGIHWATAEFKNGKWMDWKVDDFDPEYDVGELHFSKDGNELYYHSSRPGGKGGMDIWMLKKVNDEWTGPFNLENVNSERDEGWPALSPDENELWISKDYSLWRSKKVDGVFQEPKMMFSPLAGEATIDSQGNVYFTHHFFDGDDMIEADIYVAKRK